MKKMLLSFILATAAEAFAGNGDFTVQHIGPFDYYDGNGWSATGQQIGDFEFSMPASWWGTFTTPELKKMVVLPPS